MAVNIVTPAGRIVGGDCWRGNTTDATGAPLIIKNGPNAGQPRTEYYLGLAIPKTDPDYAALYAQIVAEAKATFPTLFDAAGNCVNPAFAFKVTDGDSEIPNKKGIRPCDREGYPGHWILHFSTSIAPTCYETGGAALITDPERIKRGYWVRVGGSVVGNGSVESPGVFLNQSMIEFVAYGQEIKAGPDAKAVFGGTPVTTLPPGASATPLTPTTPPPSTGVPAPAPMPQQGPPPAPVPFADGPRMYKTADGQQWTHEQLVAAGYTPEQIAGLTVA